MCGSAGHWSRTVGWAFARQGWHSWVPPSRRLLWLIVHLGQALCVHARGSYGRGWAQDAQCAAAEAALRPRSSSSALQHAFTSTIPLPPTLPPGPALLAPPGPASSRTVSPGRLAASAASRLANRLRYQCRCCCLSTSSPAPPSPASPAPAELREAAEGSACSERRRRCCCGGGGAGCGLVGSLGSAACVTNSQERRSSARSRRRCKMAQKWGSSRASKLGKGGRRWAWRQWAGARQRQDGHRHGNHCSLSQLLTLLQRAQLKRSGKGFRCRRTKRRVLSSRLSSWACGTAMTNFTDPGRLKTVQRWFL